MTQSLHAELVRLHLQKIESGSLSADLPLAVAVPSFLLVLLWSSCAVDPENALYDIV